MKKWLMILLLFFINVSCFATDLTLNQARQAGRVGETITGYLAALTHDEPTLKLVEQVNKNRMMQYQKIADEHQISIDSVAKLVAKKLISRAEKGQFIQDAQGNWQKK